MYIDGNRYEYEYEVTEDESGYLMDIKSITPSIPLFKMYQSKADGTIKILTDDFADE